MMDLFEDLPEPGGKKDASESVIESNTWGSSEFDIFSDLPVPTATEGAQGIKRKLDDEDTKAAHKNQRGDVFKMKGFSAEKKGEREEMQDFHMLIDDFLKQVPQLHSSVSRLSYYAVFDGHGGTRASKFAASNLHLNLAQKFPKGPISYIEKDIKRAVTEAFKKTDEEFLKLASKSKPSWKDGTTAIMIIAIENILYIANLGDSKAILCRYNKNSGKYVPIPLSSDHSPTDYKERMRIQKAGGSVRDGRVMGVIEVSRSIGDGQYKALGVCSVPEIKRCQLTDDDMFVLLACDGLWKVFTSEEVIDVVLNSKKEGAEEQEICYETACNKLVNESIRKYSGDNVTVVIASIKKTMLSH